MRLLVLYRPANLFGANLEGANLSRANLSNTTLCGANIDAAIVARSDIGGPGHILYALTDDEAEIIRKGREALK
jgi:hypothetical protein